MEKLGVTSTLNISNKFSWSKARTHAKHDPNVNHSNKEIQPEYTHYNSAGTLIDYDELMESRYHDKVVAHDEKALKNRNPSGVYGSVKNYLKDKKVPPYRTMVMTFSDLDTKNIWVDSMENGKGYDYYLPVFNQALVDYVKGFNERNSQLKITEYVTNVDEKGAPHVHAQIVPVALTKKGAPSASFDNALKKQFGINDGRKAMKMLRKQEDSAMIDSMNLAFKNVSNNQIFKDDLFTLYRKDLKTSTSLEIFKEQAKLRELKSKNKKIESQNKKIKSAFDKEIEKGIYESYFNLTDAEFYQSKSMSDEIVPKLASGEKSFDPIDDSVHDGAGDNEKTFSGLGLISKFNNMYVESLLRFEETLDKLKNKLINQYKSSVESLVRKEHSLHDFAEKLSKRESNMNDAERKALEDIESKNIDGSIKDFNPKSSSILNDFRDSNEDAVNDLKKAKKPQKRHAINLSADGTKIVMSKDAFSNNHNQERGNQPPRNPRLFGR